MKVVMFYDRPELFMDYLEQRFPEAGFISCRSYAELPALLAAGAPDALYGIVFAGRSDYPRAAMLETPSLSWISVGGSGTDHLAPWDPARLTVTNSAGVSAGVMAQYALAAILPLSLGLPGFAAAQPDRRLIDGRITPLAGPTAAVTALGRNARAVAPSPAAPLVRAVAAPAPRRAPPRR